MVKLCIFVACFLDVAMLYRNCCFLLSYSQFVIVFVFLCIFGTISIRTVTLKYVIYT